MRDGFDEEEKPDPTLNPRHTPLFVGARRETPPHAPLSRAHAHARTPQWRTGWTMRRCWPPWGTGPRGRRACPTSRVRKRRKGPSLALVCEWECASFSPHRRRRVLPSHHCCGGFGARHRARPAWAWHGVAWVEHAEKEGAGDDQKEGRRSRLRSVSASPALARLTSSPHPPHPPRWGSVSFPVLPPRVRARPAELRAAPLSPALACKCPTPAHPSLPPSHTPLLCSRGGAPLPRPGRRLRRLGRRGRRVRRG